MQVEGNATIIIPFIALANPIKLMMNANQNVDIVERMLHSNAITNA